MYYLRSRSAVNAVKFTVDKKYTDNTSNAKNIPSQISQEEAIAQQLACSIENPDDCVMCGS